MRIGCFQFTKLIKMLEHIYIIFLPFVSNLRTHFSEQILIVKMVVVDCSNIGFNFFLNYLLNCFITLSHFFLEVTYVIALNTTATKTTKSIIAFGSSQNVIRLILFYKSANQYVKNIPKVIRPMKEKLKEISTQQVQHQLQDKFLNKDIHVVINYKQHLRNAAL